MINRKPVKMITMVPEKSAKRRQISRKKNELAARANGELTSSRERPQDSSAVLGGQQLSPQCQPSAGFSGCLRERPGDSSPTRRVTGPARARGARAQQHNLLGAGPLPLAPPAVPLRADGLFRAREGSASVFSCQLIRMLSRPSA